MATLKQKLDIELKRLRDAESLLKSAKYQEKIQGDKVTAATKKALSEAPKKIEEAKKRVAAAEKALAEKKAEEKKATLTPQQKAVKNKALIIIENNPIYITISINVKPLFFMNLWLLKDN